MGNTDKFDSIANSYDNPERHHIAKVASDAIKEYLGETKSKKAIDFISNIVLTKLRRELIKQKLK